MAATSGDFLRAGRADVDAVALSAGEATAGDVLTAVPALHRLVTAMWRCAGSLVPHGDVDAVVARPGLGMWLRVAIDATDALRLAAGSLQPPAALTGLCSQDHSLGCSARHRDRLAHRICQVRWHTIRSR